MFPCRASFSLRNAGFRAMRPTAVIAKPRIQPSSCHLVDSARFRRCDLSIGPRWFCSVISSCAARELRISGELCRLDCRGRCGEFCTTISPSGAIVPGCDGFIRRKMYVAAGDADRPKDCCCIIGIVTCSWSERATTLCHQHSTGESLDELRSRSREQHHNLQILSL